MTSGNVQDCSICFVDLQKEEESISDSSSTRAKHTFENIDQQLTHSSIDDVKLSEASNEIDIGSSSGDYGVDCILLGSGGKRKEDQVRTETRDQLKTRVRENQTTFLLRVVSLSRSPTSLVSLLPQGSTDM